MRIFLIVLAFGLFSGSIASAVETTVTGAEHTTELWQGKALGATFRVGICYRKNGQAQGVLLLRHRNGQQDVYHLYGTLSNNEFHLTHSSGHKLQGTLTGENSMKGRAKLANGLALSLSGKRERNARLAAADCAPLGDTP